MCCLLLHFSDFKCVIFSKKIKNLLQFTFEKNNLCKKEKKITCCEKKIPAPPPPHGYQMVCSICRDPTARFFESVDFLEPISRKLGSVNKIGKPVFRNFGTINIGRVCYVRL